MKGLGIQQADSSGPFNLVLRSLGTRNGSMWGSYFGGSYSPITEHLGATL